MRGKQNVGLRFVWAFGQKKNVCWTGCRDSCEQTDKAMWRAANAAAIRESVGKRKARVLFRPGE